MGNLEEECVVECRCSLRWAYFGVTRVVGALREGRVGSQRHQHDIFHSELHGYGSENGSKPRREFCTRPIK